MKRTKPGERRVSSISRRIGDVTTTSARSFSLDRLVRPSIKAIHSYVPAKGAGVPTDRVIRLDMNESPYPPSDHVRAALAAFLETNRYPAFDAGDVREPLAAYAGVPVEQLVAGAGLDDVLNVLFQTFLEPGDQIIISDPTFGVYRHLASIFGAETVNVPLLPGWELDADGVLAAVTDLTKIIVICSPNNPTGNQLDHDAIEKIVRDAPCFVAIDEAYSEFAGYTHLPLLERYPNVGIFRTMSKFAGMAGMRVGYGIYPVDVIQEINKVVPAFHNVSAASAVAVTAALEDIDTLRGNLERTIVLRDLLADNLREIPGVEPYPSETNFILIKLPVEDAGPIVNELANRGIFVRYFGSADPVLKHCIRPSIGTTEENEIFLNELADILATGAAQ
jgi:histidinol-phosphate aminotransferase